MTVRFVKSWNGYYEGQIVTSPNGGQSEATLIALGYAVADLDGPDNSPVPVFAQNNPLTGEVIKTIWNGTHAQYDAIATKDASTLYVIAG